MTRNSLPLVVVADPDPAYQHQITSLLQPGFRCITTSTLAETYQVIRRERPVLLALELNQPDGDGIAFIERLQADSTLKHVLIACVTQRSTTMDKIRAFRAGADDYIVKPLSLATSFYGRMLLLQRSGHMARASTAR